MSWGREGERKEREGGGKKERGKGGERGGRREERGEGGRREGKEESRKGESEQQTQYFEASIHAH